MGGRSPEDEAGRSGVNHDAITRRARKAHTSPKCQRVNSAADHSLTGGSGLCDSLPRRNATAQSMGRRSLGGRDG